MTLDEVVREYRAKVGNPEMPRACMNCGGEGPGVEIIGGVDFLRPCGECGGWAPYMPPTQGRAS